RGDARRTAGRRDRGGRCSGGGDVRRRRAARSAGRFARARGRNRLARRIAESTLAARRSGAGEGRSALYRGSLRPGAGGVVHRAPCVMTRWNKLLAISVPAVLCAALVLAIGVEIWTRARWNDRKGTPGFFLSHPVRGQRLAPGYRGWFAGVPVAINQLGF